ncbi:MULTISPECIES: radical SAM protein [unclassified Desulfovibrio]|uniref:radical SAM protein n=1 Tax=unclassified Desulfovibrio TaxID=2593640 RepID=UPI0013EDBA11|nr:MULTISPECIES: radical SAM protein [unclassified Desulfovibrio]
MEIEALKKKYAIPQPFFSRYFERNAEMRLGLHQLEFMLWKRGHFIPPPKKKLMEKTFLQEEIENFYIRRQINLPQLQFAVTTRCTLRCKNCNAYSPRFGHGTPHVELAPEDFARDLRALEGAVNSVRRFMLLGGEPLAYGRFAEILALAAASPLFRVVEVVTNGTLPPSEAVLRVAAAHRDKIYFHVSNYAVNPALLPRLRHEELFACLKERAIPHQMARDVAWSAEPPMSPTAADPEPTRKNFGLCWMKRTLEAKNGRIAVCPKASSAYELGMVPAAAPGEVVDLRGPSDVWEQFAEFYSRPYFEVCRHCVRPEGDVMPAEQLPGGAA